MKRVSLQSEWKSRPRVVIIADGLFGIRECRSRLARAVGSAAYRAATGGAATAAKVVL